MAWVSGPVECSICTHEWIAVRPLGTDEVECPNCGNMTDSTIEDNGDLMH